MRLPAVFCSKLNKTLFFFFCLSNDGLADGLGGLEKKDCSKLRTELWERAFCFHFRPASFLVVLILLKLLDIFFFFVVSSRWISISHFFFVEVLQLSSICAKCWRRAERGTDERSLPLTDNAFSFCTHCVDHLTVESSADVTSLPLSLPSCLLY